MSKFLLILLGLCCFHSARAQLNWKSKGPLYEDKYIIVEIEYAMGKDPCGTEIVPSQYRYKVTRLKKQQGFYINWRFDYFNCDHQLKTHLNSLRITKETRLGYIIPEDNQFSALRLANNFNDVKRSLHLPEVAAYEPESPTSLEPKAISGDLTIDGGETAKLTFVGGYLAANTAWRWYEGSCEGKLIGTGASITVQPRQTTTYALRGEGQSPTPCVLATVKVSDNSFAAAGIDGKSQLCDGEKDILLTVTGGKLANGAKWVWYQDNCDGAPFGEGQSVHVSPVKTTIYYARAEGPGGNTICRAHELIVAEKSKAAERIDGVDKVFWGESFTLSVHGGALSADAKWVWYSGLGELKRQLGAGRSFTIASPLADQTYYVRAEGACSHSEYVSKTVRVSGKKNVPRSPNHEKNSVATTYFINAGAVASSADQLKGLKNYVLTLGGGKNIGWFARAKINADPSKAAYESAGAQITGYNESGYYQYNSKKSSRRSAYTGGVYLGGRNLAVYIGGGYGTRDMLYGIDQYGYGTSFFSKSGWVKNNGRSYRGAEIEGGLILKTGFFNMMGGMSTIQGKYTDYNLGIGLNF